MDDTVVCILRGGFTTVERTLLHVDADLAVEVFVLDPIEEATRSLAAGDPSMDGHQS